MFELAATSLPPTTANPALLPTLQNLAPATPTAANPEFAADTGHASQGGLFQALLALQTAPAIEVPTVDATAAQPKLPLRQPGGKVLPDAAIAVAAEPVSGAPASGERPAVTDDDLAAAILASPAFPALPDFALIAAIFAAPQRSGAAPEATPEQPKLQQVQPPAPTLLATIAPASATIALAQTAQIELEPHPLLIAPAISAEPSQASPTARPQSQAARARPVQVEAEAPPVPLAQAMPAAPTKPAPAMIASQLAGPRAKAGAPAGHADQPEALASVAADEPQVVETRSEPSQPIFQSTAPAAPQQNAAPATRAEPRAERIDFATLVETLSRAREEASPDAVRASVRHADFGRVSLRFERDDTGAMSVAMSSADPGFVRAVTASSEAAPSQTQPDSPRGQSPQNNSFAQSGSGDTSRRQPSERHGQPAPQLRDKLRRDEPDPQSGSIFA